MNRVHAFNVLHTSTLDGCFGFSIIGLGDLEAVMEKDGGNLREGGMDLRVCIDR